MSSQFSQSSPPEVFISYSHEDTIHKDQLVKQLEILAEQGVISVWHDGVLVPGQHWDTEIITHLNSSRLILLLISPDFLNSEYISNVELKHASKRHLAGEAVVIPVLVRDVNSWQNVPFGDLTIGKLQSVPKGAKGAKFIEHWRNYNDAYVNAARGIEKAAKKFNASPLSTALTPIAVIPDTLVVDFIERQDREGRNIMAQLKEELAPRKNRSVALWGPGGVGKTTLAAELARALAKDYMQRVVWINTDELKPCSLSTVLDEIAKKLGRADLPQLAFEPKLNEARLLIDKAPTLVVLDSFETIELKEQEPCLEWIKRRKECSALITTRQRVDNVSRKIFIPKMQLAEAHELLKRLKAQAQYSDSFNGIDWDRIISVADANPLILHWIFKQIDLAQDPQEVLDELESGRGSAAQRVFAYSFNLPQLEKGGRDVLLALSLFAPSASRPALAEVAGLSQEKKERLKDAIRKLAELWLVRTIEGGKRLTVEGLTRTLAKANLSTHKRANIYRRRFVIFFQRYVEEHSEIKKEHFNKLEEEKGNILRAVEIALKLENWKDVIQIRSAIEEFLDLRGYWEEAIRSGEHAIEAAEAGHDEERAAKFKVNIALMRMRRGEYDKARSALRQCLPVFLKKGNKKGVYAVQHNLAIIALRQSNLSEAKRLYEECLPMEKELGDRDSEARTLHQLGKIMARQGKLERAKQLYSESLNIERALEDRGGSAITLHEIGMIEQQQGNQAEAKRLYLESYKIKEELGMKSGLASTWQGLAMIAHIEGDLAEAKRLYQQSLEAEEELGDQSGIASALHHLAAFEQQQDNLVEADRLYNKSLKIRKKLDDKAGYANTLHQLGTIAIRQHKMEKAKRLFDNSLRIRREIDDQIGIAGSLQELGTIEQQLGHIKEAKQLYNDSMTIRREIDDQRGMAMSLYSLSVIAKQEGNLRRAWKLCEESLKHRRKLRDQNGIANSLYQLGTIAHQKRDLSKANQLCNESLEIWKKAKDQKGIAGTLFQLGIIARDAGDRNEAARLLRESLYIFETLKSPYAEVARQNLEGLERESS